MNGGTALLVTTKHYVAICAAVCFVTLGVLDLIHHDLKVGIAALALGLANGLLLI